MAVYKAQSKTVGFALVSVTGTAVLDKTPQVWVKQDALGTFATAANTSVRVVKPGGAASNVYYHTFTGTEMNGNLVSFLVEATGAVPRDGHFYTQTALNWIPTAYAIGTAVWHSINERTITGGTASYSSSGTGSITYTYTVTDRVSGLPLDNVWVYVTTDLNGLNTIASGRTNASGQVTFNLDAGTYYRWCERAGYSFPNPIAITVA